MGAVPQPRQHLEREVQEEGGMRGEDNAAALLREELARGQRERDGLSTKIRELAAASAASDTHLMRFKEDLEAAAATRETLLEEANQKDARIAALVSEVAVLRREGGGRGGGGVRHDPIFTERSVQKMRDWAERVLAD